MKSNAVLGTLAILLVAAPVQAQGTNATSRGYRQQSPKRSPARDLRAMIQSQSNEAENE